MIFDGDRIEQIRKLAIVAGLHAPDKRGFLFFSVSEYEARLPRKDNPSDQLLSDLQRMSEDGWVGDIIPLVIWLRSAANQTKLFAERTTFFSQCADEADKTPRPPSRLDQDTRAQLLAVTRPGELFEDTPPFLASSEHLQQLADILSDLESTDSLDLRPERTAKYQDKYRDNPSEAVRIKADYAIYNLCTKLYDETYEVGDGELGWAEHITKKTTPAPIFNSSLIPIDDSGSGDLSGYVSWSSLYSAMTVFVLPFDIDSLDISYSGKHGSRTSHAVIERLLFLHKTHEDIVRAGRVIFLPRSTAYTTTSTRDYSKYIYEAPFRQPAGELRFLPLNLVKALRGRDIYSDLQTIYARISIPMFHKVKPSEIIKVAEWETDRLRECVEEIQYEVANLNIEAEKIAKLNAFRNARKTSLEVGFGALMDGNIKRGHLAGATASSELAGLLKGLSIDHGEHQLKKSDLYFAFLLHGPGGGDHRNFSADLA